MSRGLSLFSSVILLNLVSCQFPANEVEKNIQRCMGSCVMPKAQVYSPVCASDGNTYSSRYLVMCRDACSTQYGRELRIVYEGPCSYVHAGSEGNLDGYRNL